MADWQPEIRFAAGWWKQRIIDAASKAFPFDSLFGVLVNPLISESNLEAFMEAVAWYIEEDFRNRKVKWNRQVPIEGSNMRRIGVEGAFVSEPLKRACFDMGLQELIPFIPSGCITIINPGKVFTAIDRRSPEKTFDITPPPEPEHLQGVAGHGV